MSSLNLVFQVSQQYPFLLKPGKIGFCCLQLKILPYTAHPGCSSTEMRWNMRSQHILFLFVYPLTYTLICALKCWLTMDCINGLPSHLWLSSTNRNPQHEKWWRKESWGELFIPPALSLKAYCSLTVSLHWELLSSPLSRVPSAPQA